MGWIRETEAQKEEPEGKGDPQEPREESFRVATGEPWAGGSVEG